MDGERLALLSQRGYGIAAARVGLAHNLYRPTDALAPLASDALVGQIMVANDRTATFPFTASPKHQDALRHLIVDGGAVRHGDYLVPVVPGPETLFVATAGTIAATLGVACNAVVRLRRVAGTSLAAPGFQGYRAEVSSEVTYLQGWPASILTRGPGGASEVDLPGEVPVGGWTVLMPRTQLLDRIQASDVLQVEGDGRRLVVMTAEPTDLGWRLAARTLGAG